MKSLEPEQRAPPTRRALKPLEIAVTIALSDAQGQQSRQSKMSTLQMSAQTAGGLGLGFLGSKASPHVAKTALRGDVRVMPGAVAAGAVPRAYEVRITTDGSEPDVASPLYVEPVSSARLRAALFVDGQRVVAADTDTPLFRVQGSQPPT